MRRQNRRPFNEERETKKMVIISLLVLVIAILAFVITFVVYSNYLNKNVEIGKKSDITELGKIEVEDLSEASSSIGKSVNEVSTENTKVNQIDTNKVAINTSKMEKENEVKENKTNTNKVETTTTVQPKKEEKIPDPTFAKPVEGEITVEFAKDTLIYSNTLQEWVTHQGIDIKAEKTTVVKASEEGTIKSIKNDPRYGMTVVIEHVNGYQTVYSNLLTAEFVKEGEKVKQGQTIGTVGNTATFEIAEVPHLHFEILKNNEYVNPNLYIK